MFLGTIERKDRLLQIITDELRKAPPIRSIDSVETNNDSILFETLEEEEQAPDQV